jgi:predicted nucleic acid-binding protein
MKNLVIDSGIAVKWFIEEDDSHIAQLIYDRYESGNLSFLAPDLIYAEFGNIVWKKLVFKNLDTNDSEFAVRKFRQISFTLTPASTLFDDAFKIAVKTNARFTIRFTLP